MAILQGSPLFGAAFALHDPSWDKFASLAIFAVAGALLVSNIWTFNDWANHAADLNDPNRRDGVFSTKGISPRGLLGFSLGLLVASFALFSLLPARTELLAAAVAFMGIVYSHPVFNAKAMPIVAQIPHLVGGTLHFLMGYSLFLPVDRRGFFIALFFGLTFTAGHLNQEVRDRDSDLANGLVTSAVFFGKRATFLAGTAVFTLAYADLVGLAYAGVVPWMLGIPPLVLYPVHMVLTAITLRQGLAFDAVARFQVRYRALYALIGLAMVGALFLR